MCAEVVNTNRKDIQQEFKRLVIEFRLLYSVTKVLKKLDNQVISTSEVESNIFLYLQILKRQLNINLVKEEALKFNINILLIKKYLSTYKYNTIINNNLIMAGQLRKAIKENIIDNQEIVILLQFEFYLHSNKLSNQAKVEILLSHLSQKIKQLNNIRNTVNLFNYNYKYLPVNSIDKKSIIEQIIEINKQINTINNFEQLLRSNIIAELRRIKNSLNKYFWLPEILSYLVLVNINLKEKFIYLLEQESKFIKYGIENLILLGINVVPKLNKIDVLDLSKLYKFISNINIWINQEYSNNYNNLMKFVYISNVVRQSIKQNLPNNHNVLIEYANNFENKEYDLTTEIFNESGWRIVDSEGLLDINDKIVEHNEFITNSKNITKEETLVITKNNQQSHLVNKNNQQGNINYLQQKWTEEQLEIDINNIINILEKRSTNAPKQIIKLKYSDLILNKIEVNLLLNINNQKNIDDKTKNILIKRAIALFIELQEIVAFYEKKVELLGISWGIYGLKSLLYYLEEAKIVISNMNNYINSSNKENENIIFDIVLIKDKLEKMIQQVYILFDKAEIKTFPNLVLA